MSRDLRESVDSRSSGSTICYAFMQATGMVNDHVVDCFRYEAANQPTRTSLKRAATLRRSATKSA